MTGSRMGDPRASRRGTGRDHRARRRGDAEGGGELEEVGVVELDVEITAFVIARPGYS